MNTRRDLMLTAATILAMVAGLLLGWTVTHEPSVTVKDCPCDLCVRRRAGND